MKNFVKNFILKEKIKAKKHGISFVLENSEKVKYAERVCNGFFEANWPLNSNITHPYLTAAIGKEQNLWLPILVHETSHMDQYIEKSAYWMNTEDYSILDKWLEGGTYSDEDINKTINNIISLEADCEIRTIKKIKEYNLPIDLEYYSQRANAYLLFHHALRKERLWCKKTPGEVPEILNKMDKKLKPIEQYLQQPSKELLEILKLCL